MSSVGTGYSLEKPEYERLNYLHPAVAMLFGVWYSIICSSAMGLGTKSLVPNEPTKHFLLNAFATVVGTGLGSVMASILARKAKIVVGCISCLPLVGFWLYLGSLGPGSLPPVFGFPLSVYAFSMIFMFFTLIAGAVGSTLGFVSSADAVDENTLVILSVRSRHWFWLWIPTYFLVSALPVVVYWFWLEIVAGIYESFHPALWFGFGWTTAIMISGLLGILGMAGLVFGAGLVVDAVSNQAVSKLKAITYSVGGLLLMSVLSPFLFNWSIAHLKELVSLNNKSPWWLL